MNVDCIRKLPQSSFISNVKFNLLKVDKINTSWVFIIIVALFLIFFVWFVIKVAMFDMYSEVGTVYFNYANDVVRGITSPNMEYPPFGFIFIMIPRLFTGDPSAYEAIFAAETFIFFVIGIYIVKKLAEFYSKSQNMIMLAYAIFSLIMLLFIVDRYDIFPMVITLASLYCFVKKRYMWAFILLSVATMTKIYPVVLFPAYIIPFFVDRDWKRLFRIIGALIIIMALLIVVPYMMGSGLITQFIEYHTSRPVQVESVAASFIAVAKMLGLTNVDVVNTYGSCNFVGDWPDKISPCLSPLMLVCILIMYVFYAYLLLRIRKTGNDERARTAVFGCAALLSTFFFMAAGVVFSAQYMLWAAPFILFLLLSPIKGLTKQILFVTFAVTLLLTYMNSTMQSGDQQFMVILMRNLILLALMYYIFHIAWNCSKGRGMQAFGSDS
jgi:hypothetical protein